ncbi:MAG TPA: DUF488 domain-containing protein [Polyangiaceae bacterium]
MSSRKGPSPPILYTIGHSDRTLDGFLTLLDRAGVRLVVDIRRFPRSRTNPQFDEEALSHALAQAGIGYRHAPALGGRRGKRDAPATTHGEAPATKVPRTQSRFGDGVLARFAGWEVAAFRAYAAYATTAPFREALDALVIDARRTPTAVMCAEAVWWRCHRRIVADYAIAAGLRVVHLLSEGHSQEGAPTPFARLEEDATISYPAERSAGTAG